MASFDLSGNSEAARERPLFQGITSLTFFKELQEGRRREIRRRIATDFYEQPEVIEETAEKIMESGDLSQD